MNSSNNFDSSKIILAKWKDRFFAWVIDFVIISLISTSIVFISFQYLNQNFEEFITNDGMYVPTSVLFFSYWIILEYKTGQTLGKKIFNLKITNIDGNKPDLISIVISSFGKSFILPLDIILGLIFTNEKRQRIFNKLGRTIIIKIKESSEDSDIKYIKD
ncbi:RDD family protein [Nitrosopumilus sp. Nsub]|uniref:RDD family protein n=1 Tax=Nitrosopumilus sp. Nsub TaxID=1776294 RepID=UPI00083415FA|nr:RDD family protein [Nitrosopumilus sp. Nsub]